MWEWRANKTCKQQKGTAAIIAKVNARTHAARLNENIYVKQLTKDHLLKENKSASQLFKADASLRKPAASFHRRKARLPEECAFILWSGHRITESGSAQLTVHLSFSDCTAAILGTSDDSVLATSLFFHCRKKLFIFLPITQLCLSCVIKQRERLQSTFALFRCDCQLEGCCLPPPAAGRLFTCGGGGDSEDPKSRQEGKEKVSVGGQRFTH